MVKKISFSAVTFFSAFAFAVFFSQFLYQGDYQFLFIALIIAIVFLALFLLQTLFIKDKKIANIGLLSEAAALLLPFYKDFNYWHIAIFFAVYLLFLFSYFRGRALLAQILKIHLSQFRAAVIAPATFTLICFSLATYASLVNLDQISISRQTVEFAIRPLLIIINQFKLLPQISENQTVESLLRAFSQQQIEKEIPELPAEQKAGILKETVTRLHNSLNELAGVQIVLSENIIDAVYDTLNKGLAQSSRQSKSQIISYLVFFAFFVLTGLAYFANYLTTILSWLIFHLLLSAKFAYITVKDANQETINI